MGTTRNVTLRRAVNGAGDTDILYPKTIMSQVLVSDTDATSLTTHLTETYVPLTQKGQINGVAPLNDSGKIPVGYLPNEVFDSLAFYSAVSADEVGQDVRLADYIAGIASDAASNGRSPIGYYLVFTTAGTLTAFSGVQGPIVEKYVTLTYQNGDGTTSGPDGGKVEVGDWAIVLSLTGVGTIGDPYVCKLAIVNNVYEVATTGKPGITTLSGATNVNAYHSVDNPGGLTNGGTKVITENNLFDMMGTGDGNIARGDHNHDSSYLSSSSTSTQNGYFGDIHLKDDSTPSHYLAITAGSNLTANRTFTLNTGDVSRSLTLSGTGNITISPQSGGSSLSLPTDISFPSVLANGILYGTTNNVVGQIASTTIGRNLLQIGDITDVRFARFNADETITMRTASEFRGDIGAGTGNGTVTSVKTSGAITGGEITTTGTISHSTADGDLHVPATGITSGGKLLMAGSTAGTFAWAALPKIFYDTTLGTVAGDIIFDVD